MPRIKKMNTNEAEETTSSETCTALPITTAKRIVQSLFVLLPLLTFCGYLLWERHENGASVESGWWLLLLIIPGVRLSLYFWNRTQVDDNDKAPRPLLENPWVRYPLAIAICWMSWEVSKDVDFIQRHSSSEFHWTLVFPLLVASYFAREFVLIVVPIVLALKLILYFLMMLPLWDRVALIAVFIAAIPTINAYLKGKT
jgi:hypothetical protein